MKKMIVTIDVEGHVGKDPIEHLIFGKTDNGYYGIKKIMEEFDKVGAKVLFFVDFAEAFDYGKEKIEKVVRVILDRGHDVGVHIHPDHMADKNRMFLWEYSYDEQFEIISKCTDLYTEIVGHKPLSFRAGKYGANRDTLDILSELGYRYDFSQFYHQKWCGIKPPITVNAPCKYKGLVELPVTMHKSVALPGLSREDKVDIEGMKPKELKYALQQIKDQKFPIVTTLFMHSFSLIDWYETPDSPVPNQGKLNKFKCAIESVSSLGFEYISENELESVPVLEQEEALKTEIKWKSNLKGIFYTYQKAKGDMKRNKKAKGLVYGVRTLIAVLVIIVAIIIRVLL